MDTTQIILLLSILVVLTLACLPFGITQAGRRRRAHYAELAARNDAWAAAARKGTD